MTNDAQQVRKVAFITGASRGIDELVLERFKPCSPAAIGAVVTWLAENEPEPEWLAEGVLRGPLAAKRLGKLDVPSSLAASA